MSHNLFPGKLKKGYLIKAPPLDGLSFMKRFKGWKKRWFVLYLSDRKLFLQYYESEEKFLTGCPINTLSLEDCNEIMYDMEHPNFENIFSMALPDRKYYFSAVSETEMMDWVDKIRENLDMKTASSLRIRKSVRYANVDVLQKSPISPHSPLLHSPVSPNPLISPKLPKAVPAGCSSTLPNRNALPNSSSSFSTQEVVITPPLPPRNNSLPFYPSGAVTLPRKLHGVLSLSPSMDESTDTPPLPKRNHPRQKSPECPPVPPPHNSNKKQENSTSLCPTDDAVPLPPPRQRAPSWHGDIEEVITPPVPPRKLSSQEEYRNSEVITENSNNNDRRPIPAPRTKKPIPTTE
ncbi:uncharacterized protein [Dysidea avara]|uniref:uncharacterized protein n=1 Tax=Dysidea avara TaxID=196820 RepID=UPI003317BA90